MQESWGGRLETPGPRPGRGAKSTSPDSGQLKSFRRRGRQEAVRGGGGGIGGGAVLGVGEGRGGPGGGADLREGEGQY